MRRLAAPADVPSLRSVSVCRVDATKPGLLEAAKLALLPLALRQVRCWEMRCWEMRQLLRAGRPRACL